MPTGTIGEELRALRASRGNRPTKASASAPLRTGGAGEEAAPSQFGQLLESLLLDVPKGMLKGAGETAAGIGRLAHAVPGVKQAQNAISKGVMTMPIPGLSKMPGVDPEQVYKTGNTDLGLDSASGGESVGKFIEQILELAVPSAKLGRAADGAASASKWAGALPWKRGVRHAGTAASVASEAGLAGLQADLHGKDAGTSAVLGGTAGLLAGTSPGTGLARGVMSKTTRLLAPLLAGAATGSFLGPAVGIGTVMAAQPIVRSLSRRSLDKVGKSGGIELAQALNKFLPAAARTTAAATTAIRPRRLKAGEEVYLPAGR